MKRFILNSIIFLFLLIPVTNAIPFYLILTGEYKSTVAGSEIYYSIYKSKQRKKIKKILLGDSVGYQLFPNTTNNDTINSLCCNQAIGIVGHFLLLNNYLKAGNQVDTVFMIFTPYTFQNNLDQVYTYHYFLKPFYIDEYKPFFTKSVVEQIQKVPYSDFCRYPCILTSNWAPDYISKDKKNYTFLSPVSVDYLTKIKELSIRHNFNLIILPVPKCLSEKPNIEKIDKKEITKNNLEHEFENYFKNTIYLNDSFFVDGTHLKRQYVKYYTEYYKNKLMK